jgi:adenine phosphoribosyltransferase
MQINQALGMIRQIPDYPKPGILFQDITPLLAHPEAFTSVVKEISVLSPDSNVVAGIEARGFIFASAIALHKTIGFVPLRKKGKLPFTTYTRSYGLEYGTDDLEIHTDSLEAHSKVLLVDDVLATGGTICAALELIHDAGGNIDNVIVLIEILELQGREKIKAQFPAIHLHSLLKV